MDEKKLIHVNFVNEDTEKPEKKQVSRFSLHSNPIIQRMLTFNTQNKKSKFSFKDLFR